MTIEYTYCTDPGQVRHHNEDSLTVDHSLGLALLADGMGGHQAGEVASQMAIEVIIEQIQQTNKKHPLEKQLSHRAYHTASILLEQAINKANQLIYETAEQQQHLHGMGTTIAAALFHGNWISLAHIGDSRIYRLRANQLTQMTKDHSLRQELIDCGFYTPETAHQFPNKNFITRALGVAPKVSVDIQEHNTHPKDIYLLCSDGLNDMLKDEEIQNILLQHTDSLESAARELITAANQKGGKDNISVILIRPPHEPISPLKQLLNQLLSWWK